MLPGGGVGLPVRAAVQEASDAAGWFGVRFGGNLYLRLRVSPTCLLSRSASLVSVPIMLC